MSFYILVHLCTCNTLQVSISCTYNFILAIVIAI